MKTIESLRKSLDPILNIRTKIGADLYKVYFVTRTWSGNQIGDGSATEELTEVYPAPGIKDYSHSLGIREGGNIKQGDLILTHLSKNQYPTEDYIDCLSDDPSVEKLYKVGEHYYRVISIVENQLTWNVQVRRMSDQTRRG